MGGSLSNISSSTNYWTNYFYFVMFQGAESQIFKKVRPIEALFKCVAFREEIVESVQIWFYPIFGLNIGDDHEFVIIKSTNYFWSIEKFTTGIYVQRSADVNNVINQIGSDDRPRQNITMKMASGPIEFRETIYNVLEWIVDTGEEANNYHLLYSNCQHFASKVYKAVVREGGNRLTK